MGSHRSKEQIRELLIQKSSTIIDNFKIQDFQEQKSLKDLGADSLQIVEILTNCTRELKIKIPRSKFADIKNIEDIIQVLFESQTEGLK